MMLKRLIFTVFVLCLFSAGFAQITKSGDFAIGGNGTENLPYLLQNDDGTFYALTASTSVDGFLDKTAPLYGGPNDFHFWLYKFDESFNILWDKSYGGSRVDAAYGIYRAGDFLYLLGSSSSFVSGTKTSPKLGDLPDNPDFWMVKTDLEGNQVWDKSYGGEEGDTLWAVHQLADGSFLMGGGSDSPASFDKSESSQNNTTDPWLIKIDTAGNVIWDKTFHTVGLDYVFDITSDESGNIYFATSSASPAGFAKNHDPYGAEDIWVMKLDENGNELTQSHFGGDNLELYPGIFALGDFVYLACGSSSGANTGNKNDSVIGNMDIWILQLDRNLNIVKQKVEGGAGADVLPNGVWWNYFGGEELLLSTTSNSSTNTGTWGETTNSGPYGSYLVLGMDTSLKTHWGFQAGGDRSDYVNGAYFVPGKNILLSGFSSSSNFGMRSFLTKGTTDHWYVWLDTPVFTEEIHEPENLVTLYPNPAVHSLHFEAGSDYNDYKLISLTGAVVRTGRVETGRNTIDVTQLPAGVYIIRLEGEGKVFTKKWVKK